MGRYESPEPVEIIDRLLWRDAQQMLDRHAEPGPDGRCEWCGWHWPCPPRRLAERAEVAFRRPWRESWPATHDANDLPQLPSWRPERANGAPAPGSPPGWAAGPVPPPGWAAEPVPAGGYEPSARPRRNSGLFD
jgi:hypothetical protein